MQKPMVSDDVFKKFDDADEYDSCLSSTCSMRCPECKERNWFMGSWGNEDIPLEWECPGCHQIISLGQHTIARGFKNGEK